MGDTVRPARLPEQPRSQRASRPARLLAWPIVPTTNPADSTYCGRAESLPGASSQRGAGSRDRPALGPYLTLPPTDNGLFIYGTIGANQHDRAGGDGAHQPHGAQDRAVCPGSRPRPARRSRCRTSRSRARPPSASTQSDQFPAPRLRDRPDHLRRPGQPVQRGRTARLGDQPGQRLRRRRCVGLWTGSPPGSTWASAPTSAYQFQRRGSASSSAEVSPPGTNSNFMTDACCLQIAQDCLPLLDDQDVLLEYSNEHWNGGDPNVTSCISRRAAW